MKERVVHVFCEVMGIGHEDINENLTPDDVENWDSLRHMNMVLALEEEFEVEFDDAQVMAMDRLGSIIEILNNLRC